MQFWEIVSAAEVFAAACFGGVAGSLLGLAIIVIIKQAWKDGGE